MREYQTGKKFRLPFGWKEVKPESVPDDVATPESEWAKTAYPHHERTELRRWVRGVRFVRVTKQLPVEPKEDRDYEATPQLSLRCGIIGDDDDEYVCSDFDPTVLEIEARILMRKGGTP